MKYFSILAPCAAAILFAAASASANVPDETHWIIQKLAQITYADTNLAKDGFSLKLPTSWASHPGSQSGIAFTDPQFTNVVGAVYRIEAPESLAAELEKRFHSPFELQEQTDVTLADGTTASRVVLSGRVGGERAMVLAAIIETPSNGKIVYFAEAPETWFKTYQPVFDDILRSIHAN